MYDRNSVFEPALLLGNQIFNFLREQIIAGELREGTRLNELGLQKTFKTSRSPIREAFRRLEVEGLLEIVPRKGAFVRSISIVDIREATEVRGCLEAKALCLAADRITQDHLDILAQLVQKMEDRHKAFDVREYTILHNQFHKTLVATSGNQYLMRLHGMVTEPFISDRFTDIYFKQVARGIEVSHREIYEMLAAGKATEASRLIEVHITSMIPEPRQLNADRPEK
jgi:DNA-binding GntR family transcriptional regulator